MKKATLVKSASFFLILFICSYFFVFASEETDNKSCVFCSPDVLNQQMVYESAFFWVLVDNSPYVKGHLLVIPKRHVERAHELSVQEWADFGGLLPKIIDVFKTALGTDNYLILEKNGERAFRSVPHIHFHLLPITNQKWMELMKPFHSKLSPEELKQEVDFYRHLFGCNLLSLNEVRAKDHN